MSAEPQLGAEYRSSFLKKIRERRIIVENVPKVIQQEQSVQKSSSDDANSIASGHFAKGDIIRPVTNVSSPGDQEESKPLGEK